jgi:hypothetical protein
MSMNAFSQGVKKDTLTLPQQFDKIYRTSTSYQEYKVISKARFQALKANVTDSLNILKKEVQSKSQLISSQKDSIRDIKKVSDTFQTDLNLTVAEKNNINFLGIGFSKSTYNIIVWSLIVLLTIFLLYFSYKYKNSYVITSEARENLKEVEDEMATYKKKSLEREQKLRRELQDEINKQRGA